MFRDSSLDQPEELFGPSAAGTKPNRAAVPTDGEPEESWAGKSDGNQANSPFQVLLVAIPKPSGLRRELSKRRFHARASFTERRPSIGITFTARLCPLGDADAGAAIAISVISDYLAELRRIGRLPSTLVLQRDVGDVQVDVTVLIDPVRSRRV